MERQVLPDGATSSSAERQALPDGAPLQCPGRQSSVPTVSCQQLLRHGAQAAADSRWLSATAPRPATTPPQRPGQQQLRHSASASNKPHLAAKSTPVWLAIWHIWAGFANSQHRDATFATPKNICAHSSLLPHWAAAQTDANLSAHLHRLPTPPPYLRQMRLLHGRGAGVWCWMRLFPAKGTDVGCWMMLFPAKGAGIGWQMMLLVVRGRVPANHRAHFKNVNYL